MRGVDDIEEQARRAPQNVRFNDLKRLCEAYFGDARTSQGGSHCVYKTPWPGDPRVNIQEKDGLGKTYQVKQVIKAIDLLKEAGNADT
jgi:hypothetical protein